MKLAFTVACLALSLMACGAPDPAGLEHEMTPDRETETETAAAPDTTAPDIVSATDKAQPMGLAINRFGIDLYHSLRQETDENLVVSPLSTALALGMLLPGANQDAAVELSRALRANSANETSQGLATLQRAMDERDKTTGITLAIANRGFVDTTLPLATAYANDLEEHYGASMATVDYGQPETARTVINQWVAEQTNDLIPQLLPQGSVDVDTRLTLVNAIYLLADWARAFEEDKTHDRPFFFADGSTADVPTMHATMTLPIATGEDYQAVELPYKGDELALLIIVPDNLSEFEATLDGDRLDTIAAELQPRPVELFLPKVETRFNGSLREPLLTLGIEQIFCTPCKPLPEIAPPAELAVSDIIHATYLRLDETGTEAAAATGAVVSVTSLPLSGPVLAVDRPWFLALRDRSTGAVLFLGRVMDPR